FSQTDLWLHFRPHTVPNAPVRACDGAHHDLAAAWPDCEARTFNIPERAQSHRCRSPQGRPRMMAGADDTLLQVEHLTMRFGGLTAVDDLSFVARQGDITALIGPNGAGKTTVFNCITGFYRPSEGRLALRHGDAMAWDWLEELTSSGDRSLVRA